MMMKSKKSSDESPIGHLCPWWLGYLLINPFRRIYQNPVKLLGPFVEKGMTVLEPGCGMGYFTLDVARLVGPGGRIVAVDIQETMLSSLKRRAARAGLLDRLETHLVKDRDIGVAHLSGQIDMAFAFYMLHEVEGLPGFFEQVIDSLKPGGRFLIVEPRGHVSSDKFDFILDIARHAGFRVIDRPKITSGRTALLDKPVRESGEVACDL